MRRPRLDRIPLWQQRWAARYSQHAAAARRAEAMQAAIDAKRTAIATAPQGRTYIVTAVENGRFLRTLDWDWLIFLVIPIQAAIEAVRVRRRSGWTVGVIRAETAWRGEKTVYQRCVVHEDDIPAAVGEIAAQIERGEPP